MTTRRNRCTHLLAIASAVLGIALCVDAGYVHAKAWLAQVLLERAWARTLVDGGTHAPWPWADAAPVARLIVPRLAVTRIVLGGDDGRALAFAPGWSGSTALPGEIGLGYDKERDKVVLFVKEILTEEDDPENAAVIRFWATRAQMRQLARWGVEVVSRGRPICPQCGQPEEPEGHFCPKKNGHLH